MAERFFDAEFELIDHNHIRLTQVDCGDSYMVDLHPAQLRHFANLAGGYAPEKANQVADLQRRLGVLVDKLQRIVCDDYFRKDLLNECGDGLEYMAKLDAVLDLALEFDGGRLKPEFRDDDQPEPASATKPVAATGQISSNPKTQPSATVQAAEQRDMFGGVQP